jgi:hypothetical protein
VRVRERQLQNRLLTYFVKSLPSWRDGRSRNQQGIATTGGDPCRGFVSLAQRTGISFVAERTLWTVLRPPDCCVKEVTAQAPPTDPARQSAADHGSFRRRGHSTPHRRSPHDFRCAITLRRKHLHAGGCNWVRMIACLPVRTDESHRPKQKAQTRQYRAAIMLALSGEEPFGCVCPSRTRNEH